VSGGSSAHDVNAGPEDGQVPTAQDEHEEVLVIFKPEQAQPEDVVIIGGIAYD
jgi:hypothetical protein